MARKTLSRPVARPIKVKTVRHKMADGSVKEYSYRMAGGSERVQAPEPVVGIHWLVEKYLSSPEYERLAPATARHYRLYIDDIRDTFGWMSIEHLEDRRSRQAFFEWRDSKAKTPANADHAIAVLRLVLGWAYKRGMLGVNHAREIDTLQPPGQSRADIVWSAETFQDFTSKCRPDLAAAMQLAWLTSARLGDVCGWTWDQIDSLGWLVYRPHKTVNSSRIELHLPTHTLPPLRDLLETLPKTRKPILSMRSGEPMIADSLGGLFRRERERLIPDADLHFHDLRGSAITSMLDAGCTNAEVASISGHIVDSQLQGRGIGNMKRYVKVTRERAVNTFTKWAAINAGLLQTTSNVINLRG